MTVVDRIDMLVQENGLTRGKALSEMGINHNAFAKWNDPKCIPSGESLDKLANYFNVSTDYLLGRTDDRTPPKEKATRDDVEDGLLSLLSSWGISAESLTPEKIELIKKLVRTVVDSGAK